MRPLKSKKYTSLNKRHSSKDSDSAPYVAPQNSCPSSAKNLGVKLQDQRTDISSISLKRITTQRVISQDNPCFARPFNKYPRCIACILNTEGDDCRFKDFRQFEINEDSTMCYLPAFASPDNQSQKHSVKQSPESSSDIPMTIENARHLVSTSACSSFLGILKEELQFMHANECFRRPHTSGHRQSCDYCYTSIFNGSWMCIVCGRDLCFNCAQSFEPPILKCCFNQKHSHKHLIAVHKFTPEDLASLWLGLTKHLKRSEELSVGSLHFRISLTLSRLISAHQDLFRKRRLSLHRCFQCH